MKRELEALMNQAVKQSNYAGSYITSDPKLLRGRGGDD